MASDLRCCCGQSACAYLEHNNVALGGLEKDLEQAAKLGQVRLPDRPCISNVPLSLPCLTHAFCYTSNGLLCFGNGVHLKTSITSRPCPYTINFFSVTIFS